MPLALARGGKARHRGRNGSCGRGEGSPVGLGSAALVLTDAARQVAGGSSGIGLGCALAFARAGAAVVIILARRSERLELAAQTIRAASSQARILALAVDLRNPASVRRAADVIRQKHDVPDVVCCTAGAGNLFSVEESPHDDFYLHFQSTCFTAFNVVKEFLPFMIAARRGHIVLGGGSPLIHLPHAAAGFMSSRCALRGFAQALEEDLHDTAVRVTYCECAPLSSGTSYYEDNPDSLDRLPLARLRGSWLGRLFWMSADDAGRDVVAAVERGASFYSPPLQRIIAYVASSCVARPVVRVLLRIAAPPHDQGGPLSGHRSQLWGELYVPHNLKAHSNAFAGSAGAVAAARGGVAPGPAATRPPDRSAGALPAGLARRGSRTASERRGDL